MSLCGRRSPLVYPWVFLAQSWGSYLILQQMGMMSGVISHAVLPGISIAFFLEINLAIGAFIAGLFERFGCDCNTKAISN